MLKEKELKEKEGERGTETDLREREGDREGERQTLRQRQPRQLR